MTTERAGLSRDSGIAVEVFASALRAEVGEGPHWDPGSESLWQVDLTAGAVLHHDAHGHPLDEFTIGQEVGAVIPRRDGGIVLAVRDGIAFASTIGSDFTVIVPIEKANARNRMNDAKCDPAGRLFAGTTAFDFSAGAGSLYRIDPDLSWRPVVREATQPNGMGWSPDASRMYFIESRAQAVDVFAYDIDSGSLGRRSRLVTIPPEHGTPDGMTVDALGNLWVACFGGGAVRCFSPSGNLLAVVELPVSQVTSCAFGGSDLGNLYVTTACYQMTAEQKRNEPLAGATFVCRPAVTGLAAAPFAG